MLDGDTSIRILAEIINRGWLDIGHFLFLLWAFRICATSLHTGIIVFSILLPKMPFQETNFFEVGCFFEVLVPRFRMEKQAGGLFTQFSYL